MFLYINGKESLYGGKKSQYGEEKDVIYQPERSMHVFIKSEIEFLYWIILYKKYLSYNKENDQYHLNRIIIKKYFQKILKYINLYLWNISLS